MGLLLSVITSFLVSSYPSLGHHMLEKISDSSLLWILDSRVTTCSHGRGEILCWLAGNYAYEIERNTTRGGGKKRSDVPYGSQNFSPELVLTHALDAQKICPSMQ